MGDKRQYMVDDKGKKIAIVLDIGEYEELIEDLHDLSVALERQGEDEIPHKEITSNLKKEGIIK